MPKRCPICETSYFNCTCSKCADCDERLTDDNPACSGCVEAQAKYPDYPISGDCCCYHGDHCDSCKRHYDICSDHSYYCAGGDHYVCEADSETDWCSDCDNCSSHCTCSNLWCANCGDEVDHEDLCPDNFCPDCCEEPHESTTECSHSPKTGAGTLALTVQTAQREGRYTWSFFRNAIIVSEPPKSPCARCGIMGTWHVVTTINGPKNLRDEHLKSDQKQIMLSIQWTPDS